MKSRTRRCRKRKARSLFLVLLFSYNDTAQTIAIREHQLEHIPKTGAGAIMEETKARACTASAESS